MGKYKLITAWAKKVGGPVAIIASLVASGIAIVKYVAINTNKSASNFSIRSPFIMSNDEQVLPG